jgi:hypothetical protein
MANIGILPYSDANLDIATTSENRNDWERGKVWEKRLCMKI